MRTQVAKWGNSLAVRLPRNVSQAAGLVEGSAIEIAVDDGVVVIRAARPKYTLTDLIKGITPENLHEEILDDAPRGEERI